MDEWVNHALRLPNTAIHFTVSRSQGDPRYSVDPRRSPAAPEAPRLRQSGRIDRAGRLRVADQTAGGPCAPTAALDNCALLLHTHRHEATMQLDDGAAALRTRCGCGSDRRTLWPVGEPAH